MDINIYVLRWPLLFEGSIEHGEANNVRGRYGFDFGDGLDYGDGEGGGAGIGHNLGFIDGDGHSLGFGDNQGGGRTWRR